MQVMFVRMVGLLVVCGLVTGCSSGGEATTFGPPVMMQGTVTFDRVPVSPITNGLDYTNISAEVVRGVTVEAINSVNNTVVASTTTNALGEYEFMVNEDTPVIIRARAHLRSVLGQAVDIQVLDNTQGNGLYVVESAVVAAADGLVQNVHAPSGWNGSSYASVRAAAPFAILDDAYEVAEALFSFDNSLSMPALSVFWSENNSTASGNLAAGQIGTSFFTRTTGGEFQVYLLGMANADTDEYDRHVVIHELGHFIESAFSRSDSMGGPHAFGDVLDPRIAFSEGWGYAFAAMVLNQPLASDTGGPSQAGGFGFDIENDVNFNEGWYSEGSVQSILFDLFDTTNEAGDAISAGLGPVFSAMQDAANTPGALMTYYTFANAFETANGGATDIDALATRESIFANVNDVLGASETNNAGNGDDVLPIYTPLVVNGSAEEVCSLGSLTNGAGGFGFFNKLSVRRLLSVNVSSGGNYRLMASAVPDGNIITADPDIIFHINGSRFIFDAFGPIETVNITLPAGNHVAELLEFTNLSETPRGRTCFSVTLSQI